MTTGHHRIEQSGGAEAPARTESFSGPERMNLYHGFNDTAGNSRITSHGGGGDAGLPPHVTFDNSIYASNAFGDKIQNAAFKQDVSPESPRLDTQHRVFNQFQDDATKFAFGRHDGTQSFGKAYNDAEDAKGKAALKELAESAYLHKGTVGLNELAGQLNNRAIAQYGLNAFDKAPSQFDQSVATVSATENKDGTTTQVQFNFAQPESKDVKSVILQIPKPELEKPYPNYFTGTYEL